MEDFININFLFVGGEKIEVFTDDVTKNTGHDDCSDPTTPCNDISREIQYIATLGDDFSTNLVQSFNLRVIDPCPSVQNNSLITKVIGVSNTLTTTVLKSTPLIEDLTIFDETSSSRGNSDGYSFCGQRTYELTCGCTNDITTQT